MRCPDCNKFVSFDTEADPETNIDVAEDGAITGDVRIANNCQECGTELKEGTFDVDDDSIVNQLADHRQTMIDAAIDAAMKTAKGGKLTEKQKKKIAAGVIAKHVIESSETTDEQRTD